MSKPKGNSAKEWLRAYDDLGWIVVPIRRKGKIPIVQRWQERESNDQEIILKVHEHDDGSETLDTEDAIKFWGRHCGRDGNLGIVAGEHSDILVLDIDYKVDAEGGVLVDGEKTLSVLEDEHGELPKTVEQITGSGQGRHLVFKYRPGLRNKGRNRKGVDDDGLDVRSARGQIVVEPSLHPVTGARYRWKEGHTPWDLEPAEMPDWLYDFLPKNQEEKYEPAQRSINFSATEGSSRVESYIDHAVEAELDAVRNQGEGGRNDRLNEAAYKVASLWHHGTFGEEDAKSGLLDAARECGLRESESLKTIESGWRKGLTRPRELPAELYEESIWDGLEEDKFPHIKLNLPRLMDKTEEEHEAEVEEEYDFYENKYEVPRGTFDIPGRLGELCSWIDVCATRPAPLLTLGAAISLMSALFGRKYATPTDLRTNLYIVGVAPTAMGKENSVGRIDSLIFESGVKLVCGMLKSDAGLEEALSIMPRLLLFVDEMGEILGSMQGGGASSWEARVRPMLKTLFTKANGVFRGNMVVSREMVELFQPHLVIYGTTTHEHFFKALGSSSVTDGFLNRLLIFELPPGRPKKREVDRSLLRVPQGLVEWVKKVDKFVPVDPLAKGNLSQSGTAAQSSIAKPPILVVPQTPDAKKLFKEFDLECDDKEGIEADLFCRAAAHAQKLATIRAIGCNYTEPKVVEADAQWAINLTRWSFERLHQSVVDHVSENRVEGETKRVLKLIRDAGPDGISKSKLTRGTRWLKPRDRDDTLKTLADAGLVVSVKVRPQGKGRPSVVLRARSPGA